jgi:hypothetical protein
MNYKSEYWEVEFTTKEFPEYTGSSGVVDNYKKALRIYDEYSKKEYKSIKLLYHTVVRESNIVKEQ